MAIVVSNLTKRYGSKAVVDDLSFEVVPGRVTGFLGPNGAGKSTTMRMMVGLTNPDGGTVTVDGQRYDQLTHPGRVVGALLDANALDPRRSARNHLRILAAYAGLPERRADEVLEWVGMADVAGRHVGGFSLGMHQRIGLAGALVGDPTYLMLDEPTNGLDPEGIHWMRQFLQSEAARGKAVFVSSHLVNELAAYVDQLVVIGRGRLIADASLEEVTSRRSSRVVVATPRAEALARAVTQRGATVRGPERDRLEVQGMTAAAVGDVAALEGIALHELRTETATLEEAFLELTGDAAEYRAAEPAMVGSSRVGS